MTDPDDDALDRIVFAVLRAGTAAGWVVLAGLWLVGKYWPTD